MISVETLNSENKLIPGTVHGCLVLMARRCKIMQFILKCMKHLVVLAVPLASVTKLLLES